MFLSLGLILIVGIILAGLSRKLGLPHILGYLVAGIILGPYVLGGIGSEVLNISEEIRKIALVVILLRAGLSLDLKDLKQVGLAAFLISFLPATFEILAYIFFAPLIFGISWLDAAILGSVMAAVSPAVVIPKMIHLIEVGRGSKKGIPQLILAGSSMDDIFTMVVFTSFLNMKLTGAGSIKGLLDIPLSIVLGLLIGGFVGKVLIEILDRDSRISPQQKAIVFFATAFLLIGLEEITKEWLVFSSLLSIMAMSLVYRIFGQEDSVQKIAEKYKGIWTVAELFLFVLVGASVDIRFTLGAGPGAILILILALAIRSIGVFLATLGTKLNGKERLFCVFAYLPKATVQAAIGSIALSKGLESGNLILSVAVLGIIITAPLGSILMEKTYEKLLEKD